MPKSAKPRGAVVNVPLLSITEAQGILDVHDIPTSGELKRKFQPYAVELGALVYAWNRLQEGLAMLFWNIIGGTDGGVPLAIWNSTPNDRTQREMLRAAATAKLHTKGAANEQPKSLQGILWLLNQADRLADQRNNAIHAPYSLVSQNAQFWLLPDAFLGNPRAKRLDGKDLLKEFKWCRKSCDVLTQYAHTATVFVVNLDKPWPDTPQMPPRDPSKTRKTKRPQKSAK